MRIGAFAEKFGQSIDTIRHYMELSLIVPEKSGSQYDFDEACERDLLRILYFKERGFSLQEIKTVLYYKRLGQLTEYQYNCCYKELVRNKYKGTLAKIEELNTIKALLEESLAILEERKTDRQFALGMDLGALKALCCHECGGDLILKNARIEDNQIMEGHFVCVCGKAYPVEDGILMGVESSPSVGESFDIADYLHQTNPDYLDSIYKGLEWTHRRIDFNGLSGKTILELGCGIGFFLRHNHKDFPEDVVYYAVDRDLSSLRYLKDMLERSEIKRRVVFICSDFTTLPIRNGSVDVLVDHAGSSNFAFEHSDFLLQRMLPKLSHGAELWGTYICFHRFGHGNILSAEQRRVFTASLLQKELSALGLAIRDENRSSPILCGGPYEDFFQEGESVFRFTIIADLK